MKLSLNLLDKPKIALGSLLLLVASVAYFIFYQNPPQIKGILTSTKPGTLEFVSPSEIQVNVPFKLEVWVNTKNQNVNATGVYLRYDSSLLRLVDLGTSQSFCQFYPERRFDNNTGFISLACGAPHPGVSGRNNLMILEFMPLNVGSTSLVVDQKSQILLSDGKGTNILEDFTGHKLTISQGL